MLEPNETPILGSMRRSRKETDPDIVLANRMVGLASEVMTRALAADRADDAQHAGAKALWDAVDALMVAARALGLA